MTIPDSVTNIGESAFSGCSGLTSVTIPDGVTSIGNYAFYYCSSLTSVTIPNSVTNIGGSAFYNCSGLTSVTIPDGVTSIGDRAFYGCTGLADENGFIIVGNVLYGYTGQSDAVAVPNGVANIAGWAFRGCGGLASVTLPDSVASIGICAFAGCRGLTKVTMPNNVTNVGDAAFWGCDGLTSVTIGDSVTSIGDQAFQGCSGLSSIIIPRGVTSIGGSAFDVRTSVTVYGSSASMSYYSGTNSLTSVIFRGDAPSTVGRSSFYGVGTNCTIYVSHNSTGWGVEIPGTWNGLRIEYMAFSSPNEVVTAFGAESEVARNITNETLLVAFNGFLARCGIASVSELQGDDPAIAAKRANAYKSFVFAESGVVAEARLFEGEPKLTIDEFKPENDNWSMTVSLKDGNEAITMAKDAVAEHIEIGMSLNDMRKATAADIVESPSADGSSLTFTIKPPSGNQGFMRIKVE